MENNEEALEGPASKRMHLVHPPPSDEREVTVCTDFVKLFSKGDSVFRPNMTVQRRADTLTNSYDVQGPTMADQASQTIQELQTFTVQVVPAEITL